MSSSLSYSARALEREVIKAYGLSTVVLAEHHVRDWDARVEMQAPSPHQNPAWRQHPPRPPPSLVQGARRMTAAMGLW